MDKRGIAFETLAKWIMGLLVLVIMILAVVILKARGISLIDRINNLFRFGR